MGTRSGFTSINGRHFGQTHAQIRPNQVQILTHTLCGSESNVRTIQIRLCFANKPNFPRASDMGDMPYDEVESAHQRRNT